MFLCWRGWKWCALSSASLLQGLRRDCSILPRPSNTSSSSVTSYPISNPCDSPENLPVAPLRLFRTGEFKGLLHTEVDDGLHGARHSKKATTRQPRGGLVTKELTTHPSQWRGQARKTNQLSKLFVREPSSSSSQHSILGLMFAIHSPPISTICWASDGVTSDPARNPSAMRTTQDIQHAQPTS